MPVFYEEINGPYSHSEKAFCRLKEEQLNIDEDKYRKMNLYDNVVAQIRRKFVQE